MILFTKIRWKNFLSTGNEYTEIYLNEKKLQLIVGKNGSGKSTLLDALCFSLYNKAFRNINKPQLMNAINKKDLLVEVEFSISNNKFKVIRGMNPNIFEVYKNGILLNQDAASRDYQETLEKSVLKLNFKSFCQIVILGSASFVPFMQLSPGQRREIVEDLLDIKVFTTMKSLLNQKGNELSALVNQNKIDVRIVNEKIDLINQHIQQFETNNIKQIDELKNKILDAEASIVVESGAIYILNNEVSILNDELHKKNKIEKVLHNYTNIKSRLTQKQNLLKSDINFLEQNDNCPTCKQIIGLQFKGESIKSKAEKNNEINQAINELDKKIVATNTQIEEFIKLNDIIISKNLIISAKNSSIIALKAYINDIKNQINSAETRSNVADNYADRSVLLAHREKLINDKKELLIETEIQKSAQNILKDTGIKTKIIKQYIPIMNKYINSYLSSMEFPISFEIDESFSEKIISRHREKFSYSSFSEGEKMRINLAILFAWRGIAKLRNAASTNLLIMDEIFDGPLDADGNDDFIKILNSLTTDTNTFIISPKEQMADKFNDVIRFEKHKSFSRMI